MIEEGSPIFSILPSLIENASSRTSNGNFAVKTFLDLTIKSHLFMSFPLMSLNLVHFENNSKCFK